MGTFEEAWLCFHSSTIWQCFAWGAKSPPRDGLGLPLGSSGGYWIATRPGIRQNGRALEDRGRAPSPVPEPLPWPGGLAGNRCARGSVEAKVAPLMLAGWWALGADLLGHPGQQVLAAQVLGQKKGLWVSAWIQGTWCCWELSLRWKYEPVSKGQERPAPTAWGHCGGPAPERGAPKWGQGDKEDRMRGSVSWGPGTRWTQGWKEGLG